MKSLKLLILCAIILAGNTVMIGQALPDVEQGMKPYGSYHGGAIDQISLTNGNLTLQAEVMSYSQRGGELAYPIVIRYNGKNFSYYQTPCAAGFQPGSPECPFRMSVLFGPNPLRTENKSFGNSVTIGLEGFAGIGGGHIDSSLAFDGTEIYVSPSSAVTSDGAVHQLAKTDNGFVALDGSGFASPSGVLVAVDRHGTLSSFGLNAEDRNGNQVTETSDASASIDTLGRQIPLTPGPAPASTTPPTSTENLSACPALNYAFQPAAYAYTWNLPTVNGGTLPLLLCYTGVYVRTGAGTPGPPIFQASQNFYMLQSVVLPDNTYWAFDYDAADPNNTNSIAFGDLLKVSFPTGGSITYTWTVSTMGCNSGIDRAVQTRTVDANDGTGPHTWTYAPGLVTDPMGNDTVHTITALAAAALGGFSCSLYETQTQYYQGSHTSGTLLKTVNTDYQYTINPYDSAVIGSDGVQSSATTVTNVFPIRVTTTLPNGLVSKVETDYDTALAYHGALDGIVSNIYECQANSAATGNLKQGSTGNFITENPPPTGPPPSCFYGDQTTNSVTNYTGSYGKVVAKREYDWGQGAPGALLRQTLTTYRWQVNSAYLAANMLDLPASVQVLDGGGNQVALTTYGYDENTLGGSNVTTQFVAAPWTVRGNLTSVHRWLNTNNSTIASTSAYFDSGEVQSSTDPRGNTTTHSYDLAYAGAYPTKTCNALNQCVSGVYDVSTGLLISFTDANGQTSSFSYDQQWRMTQALGPLDTLSGLHPETDFDHSVVNQVKRSKLQAANKWITDYVYFDAVGRAKQTQLVDPEGDDFVDTTYDALSRPNTASNPHRSASLPTDGITTTTYDALGRTTQLTAQDGGITSTDYSQFPTVTVTDPAGKMKRGRTDALGRLVEVDEPSGGSPGASASGQFTISGNLLSVNAGAATITIQAKAWGPGGNSITIGSSYTYNSTVFHSPSFTTINSGATLAFGTNPTPTRLGSKAWGTISINGADQVTGTSPAVFDTGIVSIAVNGASYRASFGQGTQPGDIANSLASLVNASDPSVTASVSIASNPIYDAGQVRVVFSSTGLNVSVSYGPNSNSTAAQISSALAVALNSSGSVTATASGTTVSVTYNTPGSVENQTVTVVSGSSQPFTFPSGSFTSSGTTITGGIDPTPLSLTTPSITLYTYNALGDLTCVVQKALDTTPFTTCAAAPSTWRPRSFTYDSFSRLLTATNPESGTISYSYDAGGNMVQKISPAPNQTGAATQIITYCYDKLNRITGRGYGSQPCPLTSPAATYTYDVGTNSIGHMTSLTDQAGTNNFTYDPLGRMTGETRTIGGNTKSMHYSYYLDSTLQSLTYPSGATVTYTQTLAGRIGAAQDTANNINYATGSTGASSLASHAPDGSITGFVSGATNSFAGITNSVSYNKRLQPVTMAAAAPTISVLSLTYDFHIGAGDNGNVWAITNNKDISRNQTFGYDQLNRLTSAQNAGSDCTKSTINGKTEYWGNLYGYDAWGNLVSKTITKCGGENLNVTALANNQLTGYVYDAAGNMTHDATSALNYTYDQENRITGAAGYTYAYDADGNRVEKTNGSTGTLYWYMTPGIVAESDLTGNLQAEYMFFNGTRVARRDFPGGALSYYFSDHLKTTDVVTDTVGNIKNESDFYPWGGELQFAANDSNHYKFTGKERDTETGLDNSGSRMYGNALGRFITPDPLLNSGRPWDPQTWNRYAYSHNNPLRYVDPSGLYDWQANAGGSATDDELREKSQNKDLSRKDRNAAKNALKFRDKFRAALAAAIAAAAGTGDSGAPAAYGAEGYHNGVSVGTEPGHGGGTIVNAYDSISVNIGEDVKAGNEMATVVAHEGQHVEDGQAWIDAGHPTGGPLDLNHYQRETRAWGVSARIAQALGMSHYGPCCRGSEDYVWNSSWHNVDRVTTAIEHIVRDLYSETPGDKDVYSKENPHIHGLQLRCDCH